MLISLLRRYLPPYRNALIAVVVLQFFGTIASLYLPTPERRHHRQRRRRRATPPYILRDRRGHARDHARADRRARSSRSTSARARRWASAATCARAIFHRVGAFSAREVGAVRRAVAHHPHHERRAAGADARADDLHADGRRRRSCASAASSWRCGRTSGSSWLIAVAVPVLLDRRRAHRRRGWCRCSAACRSGSTASTGSCASSSPASAWSARSCASRSSASASRGANADVTDVAPARRHADGADVPDRDARAERLERRGDLVRRPPHRRRRRCRSARSSRS